MQSESFHRSIEAQLERWKDSPSRQPLLLNGARQVGKTYILRKFGERRFGNVCYVNLELLFNVDDIFGSDIAPAQLVRRLEVAAGERIVPGSTLLILDEIQSCERALTSLKYFCEMMPELHVAAAGSLLGVAINRKNYSFPVGKVHLLRLQPLDFGEYLLARGEETLAVLLCEHFQTLQPLPEAIHAKASALYLEYLVTGGMPAAVGRFLERGSLLDVAPRQLEILDSYIADMAKYASPSEAVKIRACYESLPSQLAKENRKFQYKVVKKGGSASLFGAAIDWLEQAGVVLKCKRLDHAEIPLEAYADLSAFKLYMSDVGMLAMKSRLPAETVLANQGNTFLGALAENYAAQQLAALGKPLYYWEGATAEVDFVLQLGASLACAEIKKGVRTRSRSLSVFRQKYRPDICYRFSLKNFGNENGVRAVPLYAMFCLGKG